VDCSRTGNLSKRALGTVDIIAASLLQHSSAAKRPHPKQHNNKDDASVAPEGSTPSVPIDTVRQLFVASGVMPPSRLLCWSF